jgi:cobalamin biosynthesis protein CobD/CbiB
VALGGGAYYSGVYHEKQTIGTASREISAGDIRRARRLMTLTSALALILLCAVRLFALCAMMRGIVA